MVYHGVPWYTMVHHGKPWYDHVVAHHGRTIVYHGLPWYTMVHHGNTLRYNGKLRYESVPWYIIPWCTMVTPCDTMVNYGTTAMCYDIVYHGLTMVWYTVYHGKPWYTMVQLYLPWFTMVYHGKPWYTVRYIMVYHGMPRYTMVTLWYDHVVTHHFGIRVYHGLPW